tara:strand:+ start:273 stop:506 length:234 start_codon:yes stop_codon:yes gene_type:complete
MANKCKKCSCGKAAALTESVSELQDQIQILTDERDSLWDMLDEIYKSDAKNFQESLQAAHTEMQLERLLKGPIKGEA